ncbi:hypothetical protein TSUD_389900 [Trifolium subterraneum]|uniref:Uncharacterized protein n=1 Tax=Trifolium subterraneum TaxID=3900 RepID=A0A2Z6NHK2_TRISU|nr:hypothetical protein TSUD_389900 [Trifolium subterraneum]
MLWQWGKLEMNMCNKKNKGRTTVNVHGVRLSAFLSGIFWILPKHTTVISFDAKDILGITC